MIWILGMLPLKLSSDLQRAQQFLLRPAQSPMSTEEKCANTAHTYDHTSGQKAET